MCDTSTTNPPIGKHQVIYVVQLESAYAILVQLVRLLLEATHEGGHSLISPVSSSFPGPQLP